MRGRHNATGFTLVELTIAMVLLGILAVGTFEYITNSIKAYQHASRQEQLTAMARISVEKIARELRNAHPGSVRINPTNGSCIEFFPIEGSGTYQDDDSFAYGGGAKALPTGSAGGSEFDAFWLSATSGDAVVVGPRDFYAINTPPDVTSRAPINAIAPSVGGDNNIQRITLDANYRFQHSPARRVYVVSGPCAFCIEGSDLVRRTGYTVGDDPTGGNGVLVAEQLDAGSTINYSDVALTRNAVVQVVLSVTVDGDTTDIAHEVQIRNVP